MGGVIFLLLLAFALYVRSVPPQIRSESADQQHCGGGGGGDDIPEFMYVDTTPSLAWQAARAATAAAAREAEEAASSETIQL